MRDLALFSGAGGGILAGALLGWRTVCAVENAPYPRSVLLARQRDGHLPAFPIWDDVRTFDGRPWRGAVDVVSGGFPCQDVSPAGLGEGLAGDRSGLWFAMLRIIGEVRPRFVFAENSPNLRTRGLGTVLEGLAGLGYDSRWCVLGARHVGAPHKRDRMWLLAHAHDAGERVLPIDGEVAGASKNVGRAASDTHVQSRPASEGEDGGRGARQGRGCGRPSEGGWSGPYPAARVDDGMAYRVDRTRATGNGQVPAVAALAWRTLGGPG